MGFIKTKSDWFNLQAPFTPLPKYGHLSKKTPEYEMAEPSIREVFAAQHALPDFPAVRVAAGDPDAAMPSGGPDRYKDVITELIDIPTRDGTLIELKVYKSPRVVSNAVLMYRMHGGGWCVGRHEADGAENCKKNARKLGVDSERIIIGGGSAGAQLAASLVLNCQRDGITGLIAQVLHFPPTCHPRFFPREKYEYGSYIQNQDDSVLNTLLMETFYDAYTPDAQPDYRHSPLLAESFKGLPPTLIQGGGADPLRDDAFAYANALKNDGVDVEMHCYAGVPHWFAVLLPHAPETTQYCARFNGFLSKQVGR
ncbi:hypothetical protein FGRMN_310 [Fusarium graminum]|nr:hypothetical protein FGRMN_310 [Fusarium graminum]